MHKFKVGLTICMVLMMFGCASVGNGNLDVPEYTIEDARFAGWTFAKVAPSEADKVGRVCSIIQTFATEDSLMEYLRNRVAENNFPNMTPEETKIVQDFLTKQAERAGIKLDFGLQKVAIMDNFEMSRAKALIGAVCDGIRAGLVIPQARSGYDFSEERAMTNNQLGREIYRLKLKHRAEQNRREFVNMLDGT